MVDLTGTLISYYFICKTKLWLFYNKINLEDNSEDVRIGKVLHEIDETKVNEVSFENIKVDKITKDYVIEVKKSDSDLEAAKWQLLFYLYRLKQKGIIKKGKLEVFEKRKQNKKRIEIELNDENEKRLLEIIKEIENLLSLPMPEPVFESKCKKCAYYEFCFL
ncbi:MULTISPECIES: CRISPR-associated protein Cas4 [unclassified Lebetimonas]|uniref:CRISPR-associated protein Cas4 n=1 Tax=unclassified Lebetimonas TaxID=2648158 RepID=UPI00046539F3|nr:MULTISPECIES: CRISPR-associated protein Cas4 [unclassified Lebetimonas]